jgi:hypothetical protein
VTVSTGGRRRSFGAVAVLLLCAAGGQAASMTTLVDPRTLPVTSELAQRLQRHVTVLASPDLRGRKPGTEGNRKAADYIAGQFHAIGLEPLASLHGYRQQLDGGLGDNLIGLRPAAGPTDGAPWILVGAHFDHLGGNYLGADDNASSVGILLETARAMPAFAHHHLLFVAFNAEEPPYIRTSLMGSQQFVDHPPPEIGLPSRFQAVIIMDLMGGVHWTPLRDTLFAAGAEQSPGLYARLMASRPEARGTGLEAIPSSPLAPRPSLLAVLPLGMHLIEELPLVGRTSFSDYDAFRNAGVPFLFLSSGRTPRYHQPSDLPDTLHYERMAMTVGWMQRLLQALDEDKEPYRFERGRMELADDIATLRLLTEQAAREDSEIPGTSFLSRSKMRTDAQWLERLDPAKATADDIRRLQRLSLRMQCLLVDFPACFLL